MEQPALYIPSEVVTSFDLNDYKCAHLPGTFWRVIHSNTQSRQDCATGDIVAADSTRIFSDETSLKQAVESHFVWNRLQGPSCFLSVFSCEQHARIWAKRLNGEVIIIHEIDTTRLPAYTYVFNAKWLAEKLNIKHPCSTNEFMFLYRIPGDSLRNEHQGTSRTKDQRLIESDNMKMASRTGDMGRVVSLVNNPTDIPLEISEVTAALGSITMNTPPLEAREPSRISQPAYHNRKTNYEAGVYRKGTSTKPSKRPRSSKKTYVRVSDGDAYAESKSNAGTSSSGTKRMTKATHDSPKNTTPKTKEARVFVRHSRNGRKSIAVGFDDNSNSHSHSAPRTRSRSTGSGSDFEETMNGDELYNMSLVADFIDPANDEYNIERSVTHSIAEAVRTKRVSSAVAKAVLSIIRDDRSMRKSSAIADDLGYGERSNDPDITSSIMLWIIRNAVEK